MFRMNRKVEYALMALKRMSERYAGQLTSAKEVCDVTGAPFDATARVMQIMAQRGLLKSEQGAHGGYLLVKDLSKISFFDLVEMILGPVGLTKCLQLGEACELQTSCNIHSPAHVLNQKLADFYKGITLKEILLTKAQKSEPQVSTSGGVGDSVSG